MASAKTTARTKKGTAKTPKRKAPPQSRLTPRGAEIIRDLEELRDALATGIPVEQKFRVTYYTFDFKTPKYGPEDVKRVRQLLLMSQANFAAFLGVDANTVQSWEQGARNPLGPARRLMQEVEANPEYWRTRIMAVAERRTAGPKE